MNAPIRLPTESLHAHAIRCCVALLDADEAHEREGSWQTAQALAQALAAYSSALRAYRAALAAHPDNASTQESLQ
jgi:hypothetical protein